MTLRFFVILQPVKGRLKNKLWEATLSATANCYTFIAVGDASHKKTDSYLSVAPKIFHHIAFKPPCRRLLNVRINPFSGRRYGDLCYWLAICVAFSIGCGRSGPERAVISGTVGYQGEPVEKGLVRFIPVKGSELPPWAAHIVDGTYKAYGKGGVPVGTHKVEILGYRVKPEYAQMVDLPPPDLLPEEIPTEQYLPEKYNTKTQLEITIEPGSGRITRDFDLTE